MLDLRCCLFKSAVRPAHQFPFVSTSKNYYISENLKKPADLSQRVIFKAKTSKADKRSEKEDSKPTTKDKSKQSVTTSKLSFDLEEENYDSGK